MDQVGSGGATSYGGCKSGNLKLPNWHVVQSRVEFPKNLSHIFWCSVSRHHVLWLTETRARKGNHFTRESRPNASRETSFCSPCLGDSFSIHPPTSTIPHYHYTITKCRLRLVGGVVPPEIQRRHQLRPWPASLPAARLARPLPALLDVWPARGMCRPRRRCFTSPLR